MTSLDQFRGDSYCGLYCGACKALNLYRAEVEGGKPACWEDLPQELKNVIPPESTIACTGCKTELLSPGCQACVIRICASGKGVEACVDCGEYPCKLVNERKAYISEHLYEILPHIMAEFSQAERIREVGFDRWREEQEKLWTCPQCGTPSTWYQESCEKCGQSLIGHKEHNLTR